MAYYTARPDPASGKHRLTKLDDDFNVEASYLTDSFSCECPAGKRPSCRHRAMLPEFLNRARNTGTWFLNWESGHWHHNDADEGDTTIDLDEVQSAEPLPRTTSSSLRRI